jgi:flagellum-specific ATP synthase
MAAYAKAEDIINIGAYRPGSNPRIDQAVRRHEPIMTFLRQGSGELAQFEDTVERLLHIERQEYQE